MDLTKLKVKRDRLATEAAESRQILEPPVPPSILTPGITKEDLEAYEELKKIYDSTDKDAVRQGLLELDSQIKAIDLQIRSSYQADILKEFEQDCTMVNDILDNAWAELEKLAEKYNQRPKINEYSQGFKVGNPLMEDIKLQRLKLDFPKVTCCSNRIKISSRNRS